MDKIKERLNQLFETSRLIFWYDEEGDMRQIYQDITLPDIEKIEIKNNEFYIKYKVICQEPDKKFLIYAPYGEPPAETNWLIDLLIANISFSADHPSMIIQDLNLGLEMKSFIKRHLSFFKSQKRIEKLKGLISEKDEQKQLALKMISVITGTIPETEEILYSLFKEMDKDGDDSWKTIEKYGLKEYFWEMIEDTFHYKTDNPTLKDLLIKIILFHFYSSLNTDVKESHTKLSQDSIIFLNRWMDSSKNKESLISLVTKIEKESGLKNKLFMYDYRALKDCDLLESVEQKIIQDIKNKLLKEIINIDEAISVIQKRKLSLWYREYENIYEALNMALEIYKIKNMAIDFNTFDEGLTAYSKSLYKFDTLYRKYIYYSRNQGETTLLKELDNTIENIYSCVFLPSLNDKWQKYVDSCKEWKSDNTPLQNNFFNTHISPYLKKDQKIFVIISDAFRYETGAELYERILKEDKLEGELSFMLSMLPSYTALGMAALLPHKELSCNMEKDRFLVDSQTIQSIDERQKVLENFNPSCTAIKADNFLSFTRDTGREFSKKYNVIYIYDDIIDATGDDFKTELNVFDAVEQSFERMEKLIKHIVNFNGTNIIITSDHGFLYQHRAPEEIDFKKITDTGGTILKKNRRFLIGTDLIEISPTKKFTSSELNISGDYDFLIAKSIQRLKTQGGGCRFVHGGSSLQEIVVPVIKVKCKRESTTKKVEVDIIQTQSAITSNQFPVNFVQKEPLSEKILPRKLKCGFYSKDGNLISDENTLIFESKEDDMRNREQKCIFRFKSDSSDYNGQPVELKLKELIENTNEYAEYKKVLFDMHIAFGNEFDEW